MKVAKKKVSKASKRARLQEEEFQQIEKDTEEFLRGSEERTKKKKEAPE